MNSQPRDRAFFYGLAGQEVQGQGLDQVFPSASLIKLFIASYAMDLVDQGKILLSEPIPLSLPLVGGGGPLAFMDPHRTYGLDELVRLMLIYSDNDATNALIDYFGIGPIQTWMEDKGFHHSLLQRHMMDSHARSLGRDNWTSGRDMWTYFDLLLTGQLHSSASRDFLMRVLINQASQSKMAYYYPDADFLGHKTGELDGIDHDVGFLLHPNRSDILILGFLTHDPALEVWQRSAWIAQAAQVQIEQFLQS